jgi:hypothetical protein
MNKAIKNSILGYERPMGAISKKDPRDWDPRSEIGGKIGRRKENLQHACIQSGSIV